MVIILAWGVGGILFVISGLHFYWVWGGSGGYRAVIPSMETGPIFRPSKLGTGVVAVLLALAAWLALEWGGIQRGLFSDILLKYGGWLLTVVFLVRAIGDFKWVGFFKKKRGTVFAKWDSLLYSPLCLLLGTALLMIGLLRMD
ncbi:hypothetical protein BVG16_18845 [Paenibacillus selenitireducens]|uniref:DUF3995 domain-containing protein n=1 Tax=Paenibacillus selenitireducens TaxID=1324314 RepID=A0A1T2X8Q8_9BACL|nr:DUF3995 domain-containing protein [Paenibacillus selenitireducens]OPA76254.1 hypothetical protein BVG16_18845 [Paenibacillus selenitireducens]